MQTTQPTVAAQSPLLTTTGYANYVLGALTVCYVLCRRGGRRRITVILSEGCPKGR